MDLWTIYILRISDNKQELKKPEFLKGIKDVEVTEGQRVHFRVKVKGYPPPRISWYKDGMLLKSSRSCRIGNFFFFLVSAYLSSSFALRVMLVVLYHSLQLGKDVCAFHPNTSNFSMVFLVLNLLSHFSLCLLSLTTRFLVGNVGRYNSVLVKCGFANPDSSSQPCIGDPSLIHFDYHIFVSPLPPRYIFLILHHCRKSQYVLPLSLLIFINLYLSYVKYFFTNQLPYSFSFY